MTVKKDTISDTLKRIQIESPMIARETVRTIVDKSLPVIKDLTPQSNISFKRRQQIKDSRKAYYTGSLRSDVVAENEKGMASSNVQAKLGYGKNNGWRSHFTDNGTIHIKAQYYKDKQRARILQIIKVEGENAVRRFLR